MRQTQTMKKRWIVGLMCMVTCVSYGMEAQQEDTPEAPLERCKDFMQLVVMQRSSCQRMFDMFFESKYELFKKEYGNNRSSIYFSKSKGQDEDTLEVYTYVVFLNFISFFCYENTIVFIEKLDEHSHDTHLQYDLLNHFDNAMGENMSSALFYIIGHLIAQIESYLYEYESIDVPFGSYENGCESRNEKSLDLLKAHKNLKAFVYTTQIIGKSDKNDFEIASEAYAQIYTCISAIFQSGTPLMKQGACYVACMYEFLGLVHADHYRKPEGHITYDDIADTFFQEELENKTGALFAAKRTHSGYSKVKNKPEAMRLELKNNLHKLQQKIEDEIFKYNCLLCADLESVIDDKRTLYYQEDNLLSNEKERSDTRSLYTPAVAATQDGITVQGPCAEDKASTTLLHTPPRHAASQACKPKQEQTAPKKHKKKPKRGKAAPLPQDLSSLPPTHIPQSWFQPKQRLPHTERPKKSFAQTQPMTPQRKSNLPKNKQKHPPAQTPSRLGSDPSNLSVHNPLDSHKNASFPKSIHRLIDGKKRVSLHNLVQAFYREGVFVDPRSAGSRIKLGNHTIHAKHGPGKTGSLSCKEAQSLCRCVLKESK